jgi:anti-anti-sigma regulatory factor
MDSLLEGVAQHHARTVILDITGVPVVDTQVALALMQAAQAVQLLGAQVILTGIRPDVAQSLVGLDIRFDQIITLGSLQAGIAYATRQRVAH